MRTDIEIWQAAVSLVLILVVVAVSFWRKLGLEKSILWAALRATVQLLAVGVLFTVIFDSRLAGLWSSLWVVAMVAISGWVVTRRTSGIPNLALMGLFALSFTVAVVLGVVFGLQIMELDSVSVVVIAGITIGNTMPAVVQAADRMRDQLRDQAGLIEAKLALGFDAAEATREVLQEVITLALVPQIERTKVVGLIALPGAMTGLLLAGTDPFDAVLIQLVVMFLVVGSLALSVLVVTMAMARQALTPDLRVAAWVRGVPLS